MITKGIRIWITAEKDRWDSEVPRSIGERALTILGAAFQELVDEGVIDIDFDTLDETEVEE